MAEDEAERSAERMRFIMGYLKTPDADPSYRDKPLVFRIITEERSHHQALLQRHAAELAALPPPPAASEWDEPAPEPADVAARRAALEGLVATSRQRQAKLFELLKQITGQTGPTGGTYFDLD